MFLYFKNYYFSHHVPKIIKKIEKQPISF